MRKVYYTLDLAEAVLLKDHLVQNGVAASVLNKGAVRLPHDGVAAEVWVGEDAANDEVVDLIRDFLKRRKDAVAASAADWRCQSCGEANPGEFEVCWSCARPPAG